MKSRVASRFFLTGEVKEDGLIAVLNPPQEYKQGLAAAIERTGDIAVDDEEALTIKKPLGFMNAWQCEHRLQSFPGGDVGTPGDLDYIYPFLFGEIPLLTTNGADGNKPETVGDFSGGPPTNAEIDEFIRVVNSGNFYVPLLLDMDSGPGQVTIEWPYSAGRG